MCVLKSTVLYHFCRHATEGAVHPGAESACGAVYRLADGDRVVQSPRHLP